ncbi:MAG: uncharacterized protein QOE35_2702 [Actinomycetota bacterium]|jgi:uncharacterized protein (TIGR01777 family)
MRVLITGSSGLIGSALIPRLEADGHEVTALRRGAQWDPQGGRVEPAAVAGHDAVVHLAGEGIGDHRWNAEHKRRVLDSRVNGTSALARALAGLDTKPSVLVSSSAIGYYGNRGSDTLNEESAPGADFLAEVCTKWEAAAQPAADAGIRTVLLRTGIVLSPTGGALKPLLPLFKLGVGGRLGSGRQYWSWITIDDEIEAILHCLTNPSVSGAVNATAPEPVTNEEFARTLGRVLHRPAALPVPRFALAARLGGEAADVMLLAGQRVLPAKLEATGFTFRHRTLEQGLRAMLSS